MGNYSHYTKAIVFFKDITEKTTSVIKGEGFTLQTFSYECSRKRNTKGMPYGPTQSTIMRFSLKSLPDLYLQELYRRLKENTASAFTIVFNASFLEKKIETPASGNAEGSITAVVLSDYDNAMVVKGMVVDINEDYDGSSLYTTYDNRPDEDASKDLMTTKVEFLLQSIDYLGSNNVINKQLPINY